MYDVSGLGARIRQLRMKKGLTQDSFAKELGISAQAVSKWETGAGCPDIGTLPLIANVLGTTIDALFGEAEPEQEEIPQPTEPIPGEVTPVHKEAEEPSQERAVRVVFSKGNLECRSNMEPEQIDGMTVRFADGSSADLSTRTVVNYGNGIIEIREVEHRHSIPEEDFATNITKQIDAVLGDAGIDNVEHLGTLILDRINHAINITRPRSTKDADSNRTEELVWKGVDIDSLEVQLSGNADVTVHSGTPGQWSIVAHGSQNFLNSLRCIEDGNVLKLQTLSYNNTGNFGLRGYDNTIDICTGFAQGVELDVNMRGSVDFSCEPSFESSRILISGSGDVDLADTGNLACTISGSGDLKFISAKNANLTVNGSGDVSAGDIDGICEIKINGSGDAHLGSAVGELSCHIGGSGDVEIGMIDLKRMTVGISGSGDVIVAEGKTDSLDLKLQGSSDFRGDDITVGELVADLSGPSDATIGRLLGKSVERVSRSSDLHIRTRG